MKQRVFRIIAAIMAVVLLLGAIPVAAILISKFVKDDNANKGPISLSVSDNMELITNANSLANGVNVRYGDSARTDLLISNQQVDLQYSLMGDDKRQVDSIKTKTGLEYISDTMDMYIRTTKGDTYYSSNSQETVMMNIFRYGYYYYDVRLEGQGFNDMNSILQSQYTSYQEIDLNKFVGTDMNIESSMDDNGNVLIKCKVDGVEDPQIRNQSINLDTEQYEYIKLTMTAPNKGAGTTISGQMFIIAGAQSSFTANQAYKFRIFTDGNEHEYYLPLHIINDYNGTLRGVRFDFGTDKGDTFTVTKVEAMSTNIEDVATVSMSRAFHTYSNKINHVAQITTTKEINSIKAVGMQTKIPANKVSRILIKDMFGYQMGLENVQWHTVEYIGFDIRDIGIFGYIMLNDSTSGNVRVELKDGYYIIWQERSPKNNTLHAVDSTYLNSRDFYIGQRIYTDTTHSFQGLIEEGHEEYHPLPANHITVHTEESTKGEYIGYDALRGCYTFSLHGIGFHDSYANRPNYHCNVSFSIIGDEYNRDIYIMATTASGGLETAALLDSSNMMLPIPLEVCKNFGSDNDVNIYQYEETAYGETIFPMVIKPQQTNNLNLINMYQNWGNYPLKQISSIEFFQPYYHLSTGVTETNCISNYSSIRLPDHRAMSGTWWTGQPQHNSAGRHEFLSYTDSEGNYSGEEWVSNVINSYGPTYSDISMSYLSYDGKIKVTYNNIEMPQTDENRSYYTMTYEFLEDVNFNDFYNEFSFYTVQSNDPTGLYSQFGYHDGSSYQTEKAKQYIETKQYIENNTYKYVNKRYILLKSSSEFNTTDKFYTTTDEKGFSGVVGYILGDVCPYFSVYNMKNYSSTQSGDYSRYCNLSFIIQDYQVDIGEYDVSFALRRNQNAFSLTLYNNDDSQVTQGNIPTITKNSKITINALIMPWGSENLEYKNNDDVARAVRESLIGNNRLKITADSNCENDEHPFIPQVKSTNGLSAELSLSGGVSINPNVYPDGVDLNGNPKNEYDQNRVRSNNVAVRINGFNNLNRPVVYEKVDGVWQPYELSSKNNPDSKGYCNDYDGYAVYYNSDGTYSYSFIVPMNGTARTFKIVVLNRNVNGVNVYLSSIELENLANSSSNVATVQTINQNNQSFVRLFATNSAKTYVDLYTGEETVTGKYMVIRYRTAKSSISSSFEVNASTLSNDITGQGDTFKISKNQDGAWHTIVVDIERAINSTLTSDSSYINQYAPNENGQYIAKYIRLNLFDKIVSSGTYIDISFIALTENADKANALLKD